MSRASSDGASFGPITPMHPDTPSDPARLLFEHAGGRIAYTDEGTGAHTFVAIPGLPGSSRDFRWLAPAVTAHGRLVRLDLPGFGESARAGYTGMSVAARAQAVLALMDGLQLGRVSLIGHSAGCSVAAHLAAHRPDRVATVSLLAPNGPTPHYPLRTYRLLSHALGTTLGRTALRPVQRKLYAWFGFPRHLRDDELTFTTLDAGAKDFSAYRTDIAAVRCPMLKCWAADDGLIPRAQFLALERIAAPGPRLHFDEGGHNIQKTRASEIAAAIADLIR